MMNHCPIPNNKNDIKTAKQLMTYQGSVNKKEYAQLLIWLKNKQYPVFSYVTEFLVQQGTAINEHLHAVFRSNDGVWKKHVIQYIVSQWPPSFLGNCVEWLPDLVTDPDIFGPDLVTIDVLRDANLVPNQWLKNWLKFKQKRLLEKMAEIEKLNALIE